MYRNSRKLEGFRVTARRPARSVAVLLWMVVCAGLGMAGCGSSSDTPGASEPSSSSNGGRSEAFSEITVSAGLGDFRHTNSASARKWMPETFGSGAGFIDYDGDGRDDILLVGGGRLSKNTGAPVRALRLYRNTGEGSFTEVTETAGLADARAYGMGVTVADYDNDGDQDFFFTTLHENKLFRNDEGTFTEVGRAAGVAGPGGWSTAGVFFDADRDGHLDLFVGGYVDWSPESDIRCTTDGSTKAYCSPEAYRGINNHFYHNNGDGTFTEQSSAAGFRPTPGKTLGAVTLDYNDDGWIDLAVANDTERNLLYENRGDGTFREVGIEAGLAFDDHGLARAGMGIDAGFVQNRGRPTVFVGNFSEEMIGVFRSTGEGSFSDRATLSKIGQPSLLTLTFGLFLFDVDLDGYLDLLAANGHIREEISDLREGVSYRQPPQLYLNQRDGSFKEAAAAESGLLTKEMVARGSAYADLDDDGDLDVLITENGGPAHLWRNNRREDSGTEAHYLRVRLRGTVSNRDGLGTELEAVSGDRRIRRRLRSGSSYLSSSEKVITLGLGSADRVDSLTVEWPGGEVTRRAGISADREIEIVEPDN